VYNKRNEILFIALFNCPEDTFKTVVCLDEKGVLQMQHAFINDEEFYLDMV